MSPPIATFSSLTQEAVAKSIAVSPEQGINMSFRSERTRLSLSKLVLEYISVIFSSYFVYNSP